mmetsp:Transcript_60547/g.119170  ORF Transcript_60547/g.119170 Transcript_60547/m.119170 type:complete len:234 (-) Transcript_60547:598-1299(-)
MLGVVHRLPVLLVGCLPVAAAARWRSAASTGVMRLWRASALVVHAGVGGVLLRRRGTGGRLRRLRLLLHLEGASMRPALLLLFPEHLLVQPLPVVLDGQLCVVVDGNPNGPLAIELIVRVVELHHVGVPQGVVRGQAPVGVELHAMAEKVQGLDARAREHLVERPRTAHRQGLEHRGRERRFDRLDVLRARAARQFHYAVQLIHGRGAWEDRLAGKQLAQDAADAPEVHALRV